MIKLDEIKAEPYINEAMIEARKSTCLRANCGAVIKDSSGRIIGRGFNSPPGNLESQRRCLADKESYDEKITDKTCCVHAEQRAIFDALDRYGKYIFHNDSTLYFVRINKEGKMIPAGEPYCTICSKSALDVGISKWVLQHERGLYVYDAKEYNDLSFNFRKN